jgi:1,4-alpha-glucan branching enzyme
MGALVADDGVGFRVWVPAAEKVEVIGTFNGWKGHKLALENKDEGMWYAFVPKARAGDEYKFRIHCQGCISDKIDPHARAVTNGDGNGIIYDREAFDWEGDQRLAIDRCRTVIYEMHMGTFAGSFQQAVDRLRYLEALGVNAIELMPVTDFPGETSWGYNPGHIYAVETNYGGPDGFKSFVKEAHKRGIAIILDVVYNHLGPHELSLWNFDGTDQEKGGQYFYHDWRAKTPWGDTRPNYESGPVRQYLRDNLMMWLTEYHVDGIRTDGTVFIRRETSLDNGGCDLPEGWSLLQWLNEEGHRLDPPAFIIAEDLQHDSALTAPAGEGGAGFDAQWDPQFVYKLRDMISSPEDGDRSPGAVAELLPARFNGDPFQSVIFMENHDVAAHGSARIPQEVDPEDPQSFWAKARSTLAAFIVLTAPGVPMLLQGQERFEDGWFSDDRPLDWSPEGRDRDLLKLYRDLIHLRTGRDDTALGLCGAGLEVVGLQEEQGWLAYRRFQPDSEDWGCLVVLNLRHQEVTAHLSDLPDGRWQPRFASGDTLHEDAESRVLEASQGNMAVPLPGYSLSVFTPQGG